MDIDKRIDQLNELFRDVDENEKKLVYQLICEVAYYEVQMEELKKLPFINVNPKNPAQQKTTAAAKLYKEFATSYMNGIRILLNTLRKVETTAQEELLRRLEEFS